jgi:ATP-dependent DNA helicase RecG
MFDDRLVFESPGDLPGLVRPDNIRHTHFSRNPKIAQYLKAYKYVKEFGEGIDRICNELETKGCVIPSFHIDAFILKATLMAEWTTEKEFERPNIAQKDDTINVQVNITELTDRQRKIFETIKNGMLNVQVNDQVNVQVNIQSLATLLKVSEKTVRRDIYVLRDMNLIQYVGSDKTGHWEVKQK